MKEAEDRNDTMGSDNEGMMMGRGDEREGGHRGKGDDNTGPIKHPQPLP